MSFVGDLSRSFSRSDFACRCGACDRDEHRIHLGLVGALEAISGRLGRPVEVTMGYICEMERGRTGRGLKSLHRQGRAAHVRAEGVPLQDIYKCAVTLPEVRGLGIDFSSGFVHVDTRREDKIAWLYRGAEHVELTDDLRSQHGLA